jgi:general secretion pathway protein C
VSLFATVAASWIWTWIAPRPEARAPSPAEVPARPAQALRLFGDPQRSQPAAVATATSIRLFGVAASSEGRRGHAIVQVEGGAILVIREGAELAPGIRLAAVHADQIEIDRGGVRESMPLPTRGTPAPASAATKPAPARAPSAAATPRRTP